MTRITDSDYLRKEQYKDQRNLHSRIRLHQLFSTNPRGWYAWLFEQYEFPSQCRLLEVGAGPGDLWHANRHRLPPRWHISLTDLSTGMMGDARRKLSGMDVQFTFTAANAQQIPFPAVYFDIVLANMVFHHIPNRPAALAEIYRVLKPGGRFLVSTSGRAHLQELRQLVTDFDPNINYGLTGNDLFVLDAGHEHLKPWFNPVELRRYPDSLEVTDADILVDYVLSGASVASEIIVGEKKEAFREQIAATIAAHGAFHISKEMGVIIGARRDQPI